MILYETLSQPIIFLIIFCVGFLSGLIFDASKYIVFLCNKNKIIEKILDCFSVILCGIIFFICTLYLNYGEFRFYLLLGYFVGIMIERFSLGLIIAKVCSFCYNKFKLITGKIFKKKTKEENV